MKGSMQRRDEKKMPPLIGVLSGFTFLIMFSLTSMNLSEGYSKKNNNEISPVRAGVLALGVMTAYTLIILSFWEYIKYKNQSQENNKNNNTKIKQEKQIGCRM